MERNKRKEEGRKEIKKGRRIKPGGNKTKVNRRWKDKECREGRVEMNKLKMDEINGAEK
jgi:hypothetical protein